MDKHNHSMHGNGCIKVKWEEKKIGQRAGRDIIRKRPRAFCKVIQAFVVPTDKSAQDACAVALV